MKTVIVACLLGMGMLCAIPKANAKEFKEHLSKEFTVSGNVSRTYLFIYNIFGFIKVEGYAGNKVLLEMDKSIAADDDKTIELGKKEFKLGFDQKMDTVMAYIAAPYDSRPRPKWQYGENNRNIEYNFKVNFTVKVPYGANLHISTVNDGVITVENVSGTLNISNVNEGISVKNAKGTTIAHTVNGNVSVNYLSNPPKLPLTIRSMAISGSAISPAFQPTLLLKVCMVIFLPILPRPKCFRQRPQKFRI